MHVVPVGKGAGEGSDVGTHILAGRWGVEPSQARQRGADQVQVALVRATPAVLHMNGCWASASRINQAARAPPAAHLSWMYSLYTTFAAMREYGCARFRCSMNVFSNSSE